MLKTGEQYRASLRDGRQVWINGERVKDVVTHPAFKPIPGAPKTDGGFWPSRAISSTPITRDTALPSSSSRNRHLLRI
jgi:hypothetical protein